MVTVQQETSKPFTLKNYLPSQTRRSKMNDAISSIVFGSYLIHTTAAMGRDQYVCVQPNPQALGGLCVNELTTFSAHLEHFNKRKIVTTQMLLNNS